MRPRYPSQPFGDEGTSRVAPCADLGRRDALPRRCTRGELGAQPSGVELVWVKVEDGEVAQSCLDQSRREHAPVASTADRQRAPGRDRQLPKVARAERETVRADGNAAEPFGNARRVVLALVVAKAGFHQDLVRPRGPAVD